MENKAPQPGDVRYSSPYLSGRGLITALRKRRSLRGSSNSLLAMLGSVARAICLDIMFREGLAGGYPA